MTTRTKEEILKRETVPNKSVNAQFDAIERAMEDYSDQQNEVLIERCERAEILLEAERNAKSQWIPVETPPPIRKRVLVKDGKIVCIAWINIPQRGFEGWVTIDNEYLETITGWKELPSAE